MNATMAWLAPDLTNLNQWVWLVVVPLISSRFRETLYPLPWIALVGQCTAWLLTTVERQADAFIIRPVEDANLLWFLLGTGVIYTALGLRNFGRCRFAAVWASLALVAPVLLFVTAYLLTGNLISEAAWSITALLTGLAYLALATLGRRRLRADTLVVWLVSKFHWHRLHRPALLLAGTMAFVFVSLEIRHLWQSNLNLALPTGSAELYTYSIVWLLIAVSAILAGSWRLGANCYRAGLSILMLVISKIFLIDMDDLEGLLRVASFMGLGLGMLGVSFLHQKLQQRSPVNV
ncbi:MAG: putative membrane protein [Candidatus Azotimanducaceae bacterium]|jgi:uncharacterized membrane protein